MKTLLPEIDSADKRFHNGNPATGEQGTRVTDTWLNDVQDRVRDVQAEAHYVLLKAGFTPKADTQTQLYQAIVKIIDDNRKSASTTQKGEVRLTSDTGLDSEELGLTARAGKKLAQQIATVQTALNNYIPLKSRSSSVTSNDENGVATPKAVKTAYDKGVEAKNAADNANNNANNRVPKTGDTTIVGALRAQHPQLAQNRWSNFQLATKQGHWQLEVNPNSHDANERRFNMLYANGNALHYLSFPTIGDSGQIVAYQSWVSGQLNNFINSNNYVKNISKNNIQLRWNGSNLDLKVDNSELGYLHRSSTNYVETNVANGGYGGLNVVRKGTSGNFWARFEALPDRRWKFATENGSTIHLKNQNGNILLDSDISNVTNGNNKAKVASEFALGEINKAKANLSDFTYQKIGNFEIRKYPDGTMVQTNIVSWSNKNRYAHERVYSFNWAAAFVDRPLVFGDGRSRGKDFRLIDKFQMEVMEQSNGAKYAYWLYDPGGEQGDWDMQFMAIGRWK